MKERLRPVAPRLGKFGKDRARAIQYFKSRARIGRNVGGNADRNDALAKVVGLCRWWLDASQRLQMRHAVNYPSEHGHIAVEIALRLERDIKFRRRRIARILAPEGKSAWAMEMP